MRVDELYFFMKKREALRMKKEQGRPWPWTDDPILQQYKFTNVKRDHDKTTRLFAQMYRDNVPQSSPDVYLLNCAIARYFGRWETIHMLGWQNTFSPEYIKLTTREMFKAGDKVFTGAYVITNQGVKAPKIDVVVDVFLSGLWNLRHELVSVAQETDSWHRLSEVMGMLPGFGGTGFMTKEVLLDTMLTEGFWPNGRKPADFNFWCPAGPGARRGLNRVFERPLNRRVVPKQATEELLQLFHLRRDYWPGGWVHLELHDIQFQLCEFDKYERVRHGEGRPRNKYKRPK